ncbi:MAG TPA: ABC transporter permease [Chloroflexota bacterium]|nr:ABC transporter permease [Chloroflexota bacterium]
MDNETVDRPEDVLVLTHLGMMATTRRFLRANPLNSAALVLLLALLVTAIFGGAFAPYDPIAPSYDHLLAGPSSTHLFGTDEVGRDVLSRVLAGTGVSLLVAAVVLSFGVIAGTAVGAVAGLFGGVVDEVIMRITDVFLAFPSFILAAAVSASLGPGLGTLMLSLSVVWWPWYARLARAQVLQIRSLDFVEAARALGVRTPRMLWRHILPNAVAPILVQLSLDVGYAILAASGLSFLGLGVQPPTAEWGTMIADAQNHLQDAWWMATFPGAALAISVFAFNLLGDGLRDFLDPEAA